MKFIGNKRRLLDFISEAVKETGVEEGVFIDLFSGATSVARHFKEKGFSIISNDILRFSFVFQKAYIEVNKMPAFSSISSPRELRGSISKVIKYLNSLKPVKGFIYNNYCPEGTKNKKYQRKYFSNSNAKKIDAIRTKIGKWHENGELSDYEFYVLLSELIDKSDYVANNSGTYGAYLKIWRSMALKTLKLEVPKIFKSSKEHQAYNMDSKKLIKKLKGDILYLDPPYNSRQYASNYHILETIAKYDNPSIRGKTGLRSSYFKSSFCRKREAAQALKEVINNAKVSYILLSYNNEGIVDDFQIVDIMSKRGSVRRLSQDFKRYRSESDHEDRQYKKCGDKTVEYIYLCKVSS